MKAKILLIIVAAALCALSFATIGDREKPQSKTINNRQVDEPAGGFVTGDVL